MQEEKRRSDNAIAEEKVKLVLESQAKEAKQVRVSSCKLQRASLHQQLLMNVTFFAAAARRSRVPNDCISWASGRGVEAC